MTVRWPYGLTAALGSERPGTTLDTYYMDGYYKQVLNSESILWGVLFWFLYALSFRPAGDHETLRGGK